MTAPAPSVPVEFRGDPRADVAVVVRVQFRHRPQVAFLLTAVQQPDDAASQERSDIQGGHRIELGYTYLRVDTKDKGRIRALPEHWFDLATVFALGDKLSATTRLKVTGAAEDPNRLVDYRDSAYDPATGLPMNPRVVAATDLVLDRLPPIAELSVGLSYTPTRSLTLRATAFNVLAGHYYQPDPFFDYEPHLEYLPNPNEGFRAYVSALYHY